MIKRETLRAVPNTGRYFHVQTEALGRVDLRFPSFQVGTKIMGLLGGVQSAEGLDVLVNMLDAAGYAIGVYWCHAQQDLESGAAPSLAGDESVWREYGDSVIDELQEAGMNLPDVMAIIVAIIEDAAKRLDIGDAFGKSEAPDSGNDSSATTA